MQKIPKRYAVFLTASCMALIMSTIITGVLTFINMGVGVLALEAWMTKTPLSFFVAWPTAVLVLPLVRKFVDTITK